MPDFHTLAVECVAGADARLVSAHAGLPDDAFEHDGKLTKREFRALGAGEAHAASRRAALGYRRRLRLGRASNGCAPRDHAQAIALEPRADRRAMAARNAAALGVPQLDIRDGARAGGARPTCRRPMRSSSAAAFRDATIAAALRRAEARRTARRPCGDAGERGGPARRLCAPRRRAGAPRRRARRAARRLLRLAAG